MAAKPHSDEMKGFSIYYHVLFQTTKVTFLVWLFLSHGETLSTTFHWCCECMDLCKSKTPVSGFSSAGSPANWGENLPSFGCRPLGFSNTLLGGRQPAGCSGGFVFTLLLRSWKGRVMLRGGWGGLGHHPDTAGVMGCCLHVGSSRLKIFARKVLRRKRGAPLRLQKRLLHLISRLRRSLTAQLANLRLLKAD